MSQILLFLLSSQSQYMTTKNSTNTSFSFFNCYRNDSRNKGDEENIKLEIKTPLDAPLHNKLIQKHNRSSSVETKPQPASCKINTPRNSSQTKVTFTYQSPLKNLASVIKSQKSEETANFNRISINSTTLKTSNIKPPININIGYVARSPVQQILIQAPDKELLVNHRYQRIVGAQPVATTTLIHSQCPYCQKSLTLVPNGQLNKKGNPQQQPWDPTILTIINSKCYFCFKQISLYPKQGHNYIPTTPIERSRKKIQSQNPRTRQTLNKPIFDFSLQLQQKQPTNQQIKIISQTPMKNNGFCSSSLGSTGLKENQQGLKIYKNQPLTFGKEKVQLNDKNLISNSQQQQKRRDIEFCFQQKLNSKLPQSETKARVVDLSKEPINVDKKEAKQNSIIQQTAVSELKKSEQLQKLDTIHSTVMGNENWDQKEQNEQEQIQNSRDLDAALDSLSKMCEQGNQQHSQ